MTTALIYYSFSGKTKAYAAQAAATRQADLIEVTERKPRNGFTAFLPGCPQAMHQKATPLAQPLPDLSAYDTIIIAAPIWAGYPAPAFNSIVAQLPPGKDVELAFTSSSGRSSGSDAKVRALVENQGCRLTDKQDIVTK